MNRLSASVAILIGILTGGTPGAYSATCYAISGSNQVLTFQSGSPSVLENSVALTGIPAAQEVIGCDVRPADGKVYLITAEISGTGRLYTLNPATGAATFVANLSQPIDSSFVGMDFNPVVDRIRLVSGSKKNLRVNPTTGEVIVDTPIDYAGGDPAQGMFPAVFACAYTNNFTGAAATALYGIDAGTDSLVRQDPPNAGALHTVGSLGVDFGGSSAFDISPSPVNHAYAALPSGSLSNLYLIDLDTGHATLLGNIATGGQLKGFTVAPGYPQTAFSRQQNISIVANGVGYQELSYNYTTGQISVTPYSSVNGPAARLFPFAEWTGVFHYDFGAAAFTSAVYSRQHPLY